MASGHRPQWKGFIKFGEVSCGAALYTAASTSDRITFNTINKATGNRVNRVFVDGETEEPVPKELQTKGFEICGFAFNREIPSQHFQQVSSARNLRLST